MGNIHFANPQYLYSLLGVIPAVAVLWFASYRLRLRARKLYGEEELVSRYTRKMKLSSEIVQLVAWLTAMVLLVVAAAGPRKPDAPQTARTGSLQVVVVMDVSKSMAAEDYRQVMPGPGGSDGSTVIGPHGSRLDMTKHVIVDRIMPAIPGNQIGIVTYSGAGFPQADLTDDYESLRFVLTHWVKVGSAPGGGSYMADGLSEAIATFQRDQDPKLEKVIVLFSDGGFNGEQADLAKVSQELVKQNIRLIVVGLGMTQPVPIPAYNGDQFTGYMTKDGRVVTTGLEEPLLTSLATAVGGTYVHLVNDKELNLRWATTLAGSKVEPHETLIYQYPLAAALALLIVISLRGLFRRKDLA